MKSPLTTHVLDTSRGKPAPGVAVVLEKQEGNTWKTLAKRATDADGRVNNLLDAHHRLETGSYRLTFDTASYFSSHGVKSIFPTVVVVVEISDTSQHYHIPLLVSPYGYSTYRGS